MSSISQMYSFTHGGDVKGIQGYYVDKKYIDPLKIKEQRILNSLKDKCKNPKQINFSKKTTFIDDIQKVSLKLPGPSNYHIESPMIKSKTSSVIKVQDRKTIFDEIAYQNKKNKYPDSTKYQKIVIEVDKKKLKSNINKAQSPTYLEASMRNSLEGPGVGNYNPHQQLLNKESNKWILPKVNGRKSNSYKHPSVGAYNPCPVSFNLFDNLHSKKSQSILDRSQRFKKNKDHKIPYYNILSQWGIDKNHKKDILNKISHKGGQSVYY